jgi:hypothetical protein
MAIAFSSEGLAAQDVVIEKTNERKVRRMTCLFFMVTPKS